MDGSNEWELKEMAKEDDAVAPCPKCNSRFYSYEEHPKFGEVFRCYKCKTLVDGIGRLVKEENNESRSLSTSHSNGY